MEAEELELMTRQVIESAKEFLIPIDYDALVKSGLLQKEGAWYRIKGELPVHVSKKIRVFSSDKKGAKVKFQQPTQTQRKQFQNIIDRFS